MGISHAEGGSLFLFLSTGVVVMLLLSGVVLKHLTHHTCIGLAAITAGAGLFIAAASGALFWFKVGLLVLGVGSGLYLPSGIVTITELVRAERRGMAISLHELGPILGLAAAPFFAEIALRTAGWRSLLYILGGVSVLLGLLYSRFGAGGRFHGAPPAWSELRKIVKQRDFWLIAFFFVLIVGNEIGVYSMLPSYLVADRGMDQRIVNTIVSTSRLTSLVIIFTAGWFADRFGHRRAIALISLICGVLTATIGFAGGTLLVIAVYLQPMFVSSFFPAGFIAMARLTGPEKRNLSVSLIVPMASLIGGGAIPALIGKLAELGFFSLGFIVVGLVLALGVLLVPLMNR